MCPPVSTTACTKYTYTSGSDYPESVLDSGPHSYWRLDDPSGTSSAASSVLVNEGADDATYSGVTLASAAGPLAGSSAQSPHFSGSSYVQLPGSLVNHAAYMSVSLWFKTVSTGDGVLFSYQADPVTSSTTTSGYTPALYLGPDGILHGQFWDNSLNPMTSASPVNDGKWHMVTMTASGNSQVLYLDGKKIGSRSGTITVTGQQYDYLGAGFIGGSWPDESHYQQNGSEGYASHYSGYLSDASLWDRPLTGGEVAALYSAGTHAAALATQVTRPSGKTYETAAYDSSTGRVTSVTDPNGGTWGIGAPAVFGSSQVYRSAVLGSGPADYWRFNDTGTTDPVNQLIGGTAVNSNITEGVAGPFSDSTAYEFNGTSSYVQLPSGLVRAGGESISLWFKTSTPGGVIFSSSASAISNSSVGGDYASELYIGTDGHLDAEFWNGKADPMVSANAVDDGKWHNVVLAAGTDSERLYLDDTLQGTLTGTVSLGSGQDNDYLGAGFLGGSWPNEAHSGDGGTGYRTYFTGDIGEVSFFYSYVGINRTTAMWNAAGNSTGLVPFGKVFVTDPGGKSIKYTYDPLNGDRILSKTDGLGNRTTYGYDLRGFLNTTVHPAGDTTITGHDVRGNMVSKTTCQDQAAGKCSTSYYTYYPDDTSASLTPDPRNEVLLTSRDPRSSSATDPAYETSYTYNSLGELTAKTTPPVAGFPAGRTTNYLYTDGTTSAGGYNGAIPPKGLSYQETTPGGAVTTTLYDAAGDVKQVTDPDKLTTTYGYDGLGRMTSKTVVSNSYSLTTAYVYDKDGRVTKETDPPVTDRVTGTVHTEQITTQYDDDGDVTSKVTADLTGNDASRTVTSLYNPQDLLQSKKDAAGATTSYQYDSYGRVSQKTGPDGNVTDYTYDPNGHPLDTTLENYTGSPSGSQTAAPLVEEARTYDPDGRLASVKDAMGRVTSYGYTDNGLLATVTRKSPDGTQSFTAESDTYDAAGNLVKRVTGNGETTTDYTVDAADRVTQQVLDPSGLDRTTSISYTPDDQRAVVTQSGPDGATRVTSYTYDPGGHMTSKSLYSDGSGHPTGWWKLDQASGSTVQDSSGTGNTASASHVTWTGGAASFTGASGQGIATNGPVLDTTASFSVSAWVNLPSAPTANEAVVTQAGSNVASFWLLYSAGKGQWEFDVHSADSTSGTVYGVYGSPSGSLTGTWTHLVGVYNAGTGSETLYVNGTQAATLSGVSVFSASGPLQIGEGLYGGSAGSYLNGSVDNVQVYPRVLSAAEVSALYGAGRNGGTTASSTELTTKWTLGKRGLPVSKTGPRQNVTDYTYDENGRLAVTTEPAVTAETYGGTPVTARPVITTGYDTFGDKAEMENPNGDRTYYTYDGDGRVLSKTLPSYTPPGSSLATTPVYQWTYYGRGMVKTAEDPLLHTTSYDYDQLGDLTTVTAPVSATATAVTSYTYDDDGERLSATNPANALTQATYDFLGRKVTDTQVERYNSTAATQAYTTNYTYGAGGWLSKTVTAAGVTTLYAYDPAGEVTSVTDGAQNVTNYGYDSLGRKVTVTYPDGSSRVTGYDALGDATSVRNLDKSGTVLSTTSATYDGDGHELSATDARGHTATFTYDATGLLTQEVQPVSASSSVTTSFGYDLAGNKTRYTDGKANDWYYTYNPWGLQESRVEPATSQYTSAADSAFTTAYDADGRPVSVTAPGGVTVTDSYDYAGDLTGQAGSGADAVSAGRSFTYNTAGDMLTAATSDTATSGQASNATSESFTYNDRGEVLSASGTAGSTQYAYNGDGQVASVADAAGTTAYTYDSAGRLLTLADPATGTTATYSYNQLSQVSGISYGTGADSQAFAYDGLHRLSSDTLQASSGTAVASVAYQYNGDGQIAALDTTGLAGASSNSYVYDWAGRLTSWDNGAATTGYGYDANGNLTQDGSKSYTYDARDELTSDGTNTYAYTARGTLASQVTPGGTVASSFDAYGDQVTAGTQSYTYDALGRMTAAVDASTQAGSAFSYAGSTGTIASDGMSAYSWGPSGRVLAGIGVPGGGSGGVLAFTDSHGDVVGQFTASASAVSGSSGYGPWGQVTGTSVSVSGLLGFQSGWTDPVTSRVAMGARWYSPATGGFTSADTVQVPPVPDAAAANPFAYVGDSPLSWTDPTGHYLALAPGGGTVTAPAVLDGGLTLGEGLLLGGALAAGFVAGVAIGYLLAPSPGGGPGMPGSAFAPLVSAAAGYEYQQAQDAIGVASGPVLARVPAGQPAVPAGGACADEAVCHGSVVQLVVRDSYPVYHRKPVVYKDLAAKV